jgi:hypothetical protein
VLHPPPFCTRAERGRAARDWSVRCVGSPRLLQEPAPTLLDRGRAARRAYGAGGTYAFFFNFFGSFLFFSLKHGHVWELLSPSVYRKKRGGEETRVPLEARNRNTNKGGGAEGGRERERERERAGEGANIAPATSGRLTVDLYSPEARRRPFKRRRRWDPCGCDHTSVNAPDPIRTPQLSALGLE